MVGERVPWEKLLGEGVVLGMSVCLCETSEECDGQVGTDWSPPDTPRLQFSSFSNGKKPTDTLRP